MANEKRLIDVERAKRATYEEIFWTESEQAVVRHFLAKLPKVDAVEVVHGRWKNEDRSGIKVSGFMACSNCNVMIPRPDNNHYCLHKLYYCPNCGAKMDGGNDDGCLE